MTETVTLSNESTTHYVKYVKESKNFNDKEQEYLLSNYKVNKSTDFYEFYPLLFNHYFNFHDKDKLNQLSFAGYLYYQSILILDSVIDDKKLSNIYLVTILQEETIKTLTSIYGKDSYFFTLWNSRRKEYFNAIKIEKSFKLKDFVSFEEYKNLADKKSAFGKVAIDSLHSISNFKNLDRYNQLIESHKLFSVGFQLYDDIKDFKEDIEKGQFNWAVQSLKEKIDFDSYADNIEALNKLLYLEGVGQEVMSLSISYLDKALNVINNQESGWKTAIKNTKNKIQNYLDITNGYIKTLQTKISLRNGKKDNNYHFFNYDAVTDIAIKKGLSFIENEYNDNYANLKHIMYLGDYEGFSNENVVHVSDTFQRALLNDCLLSVLNRFNIDADNFLNTECDYLIKQRNHDSVGGWSYFPSVKEVAADIDDLGQIIQFFVNTNKDNYISNYCKKPIEIALQDRMRNNGGVETWIIQKENLTVKQKNQVYFNENKWGTGPDVEVVANFSYALTLLKRGKYKEEINKMSKFIINQQRTDNLWDSRWYYGDFYGTYVCLRVLTQFEENKGIIFESLESICKRQSNDGGFGLTINDNSDSLSTSFALLSLKLHNGKDFLIAINKAEQFLLSNQNNDGSWNAVGFIKPKVNEPYKSKPMTTGFVLKALCS